MKVTIRYLPPTLFTERKARRKLLEATAKKRCPEINKKNRQVIREIVTHDYRNLLEQVRQKLARPGGLQSITTRGVRRIKFQDAEGKNRAVTTPVPWEPLTQDWIRRSPISVQFWHKNGDLYHDYVSQGLRKNARVRPVAGGNRTKVRKDKYVCTSRAKVDVQPLPYPMDRFVTGSFLTGKPTRIPPQGWEGRKGVAKTLYPEWYRPFISVMSASLGRLLLTKLRKIK